VKSALAVRAAPVPQGFAPQNNFVSLDSYGRISVMRKPASSSRWQGIFETLGFGRRPVGTGVRKTKLHTLRLEPLEDRHLLSVKS
jgi:hypothetical protein